MTTSSEQQEGANSPPPTLNREESTAVTTAASETVGVDAFEARLATYQAELSPMIEQASRPHFRL